MLFSFQNVFPLTFSACGGHPSVCLWEMRLPQKMENVSVTWVPIWSCEVISWEMIQKLFVLHLFFLIFDPALFQPLWHACFHTVQFTSSKQVVFNSCFGLWNSFVQIVTIYDLNRQPIHHQKQIQNRCILQYLPIYRKIWIDFNGFPTILRWSNVSETHACKLFILLA